MKAAQSDESLENLLDYLKVNRGFDFTGYKRSTLTRRIEKRMQSLSIEDYASYIDHLKVEPAEVNELFNSILINVTAFFRDRDSWDYISSSVVPAILERKQPGESIRIWSAGCASGEEAFTLAMVFAEALGIDEAINRLKIYATDLDVEALQSGRQGVFSSKDIAELPDGYVDKYFEQNAERYTFHRKLRKTVIFGKHNLISDIPISQIDLLTCRNTLMYFNAETQAKILNRLHFALADDGHLFLGKAEMLLLRTDEFEPVDVRRRVFTKGRKNTLKDRLLLLSHSDGNTLPTRSQGENQVKLAETSFEQDPLAQILTDSDGNLVLVNHNARSLFKLPAEAIGRPLREYEVSHRPVDLHSVARQAAATLRPVIVDEVEFRVTPTEHRYLKLHAACLAVEHSHVLGTRFVFTDVTQLRQLKDEIEQRKQELETAYEELQSSNEELTTTNEELQSTVEELETTNEELQSTNEELETMNEELQSTNEELEHINVEIQNKSGEVTRLNIFLDCILSSLESAVVVVSPDVRVMLWNDKCEDLWGLRSEEVIDEHLFNLDIGLPLEHLRPCIRLCFSENREQGATIIEATNRRGKNIYVSTTCRPVAKKEGEKVQGVLILIKQLDPTEISANQEAAR